MSYIPPADSSRGRSPPMYQPSSLRMQVPRSPRQAPPRPDKLPNQSAGKYSRKGKPQGHFKSSIFNNLSIIKNRIKMFAPNGYRVFAPNGSDSSRPKGTNFPYQSI